MLVLNPLRLCVLKISIVESYGIPSCVVSFLRYHPTFRKKLKITTLPKKAQSLPTTIKNHQLTKQNNSQTSLV